MKKYRIAKALLAAGFFAMPLAKPTSAETPVKVAIDNEFIQFDQSPVMYRDFTMVPMREIFIRLGAEVQWDPKSQTITAIKDNTIIELRIGSPYALINYQKKTIDAPAILINGRTLVPLRFISESLGSSVKWDSQAKSVNILSNRKKQQASEASPLTLEDAVKWAKEQSDEIRRTEQAVKRKEIEKKQTGEDSKSTSQDRLSAEIALEMSKKEMEVAQDQVAYHVEQIYQSIFLKENEIENKKEAYDIAKMEEGIALTREQLGQISEAEKMSVIKGREAAQLNLLNAKTALQEAKVELNKLMGHSENKRYILMDKPAYTPPKTIDITDHFHQMLDKMPSIWMLEKQVVLAEQEVNDFDPLAGKSYELVKMDKENAKAALEDSKKGFEETLKQRYANWLELNQQYDNRKIDLQTAEAGLSNAKTRYEKGLISAVEVKKAQSIVSQLRRTLDEIVIQIDQAYLVLIKPWIS